jgi:hypothetical protein
MKINFPKKEKSFQKISLISNVNLYWKFAVYGTFVMSFAFFFFSYYLFMQTNKELIAPVNNNKEQDGTITKERIDKALEYFFLRGQKSNQILYSSSPVVDPSL